MPDINLTNDYNIRLTPQQMANLLALGFYAEAQLRDTGEKLEEEIQLTKETTPRFADVFITNVQALSVLYDLFTAVSEHGITPRRNT